LDFSMSEMKAAGRPNLGSRAARCSHTVKQPRFAVARQREALNAGGIADLQFCGEGLGPISFVAMSGGDTDRYHYRRRGISAVMRASIRLPHNTER
jgi:hypothetical protein